MSSYEDRGRAGGPESATVRRREPIDWSLHEPVCLAIQTAVAAVEGTDPVDLPPLTEYVDPDAVDQLFDDTRRGNRRRIEFGYAGYLVRVDEEGDVVVRDR